MGSTSVPPIGLSCSLSDPEYLENSLQQTARSRMDAAVTRIAAASAAVMAAAALAKSAELAALAAEMLAANATACSMSVGIGGMPLVKEANLSRVPDKTYHI